MIRTDGLILAGGQGRRFGGIDKGLVQWRGRPLIEHVARRLAPQVEHLTICANRNAASYAAYGRVIDDGNWRHQGPLAGLRAGLAVCASRWLTYVPVDAVCLPPDLVSRLLAAALDGGCRAAVACNGEALVPTCGLLRTDLLPTVEAALRNSSRALRDLLESLRPATARWDAGAWVWSVNTPVELAALKPACTADDTAI